MLQLLDRAKDLTRMMLSRITFILLIFLPLAANAFPQRISFQNLLENKDITLGTITAFLQDDNGFMWFGGANSLIRYDGYEFKAVNLTIQEEEEQKTSPLKFVQHLFQDEMRTIWIATRTGLYYYLPEKASLHSVPDDPEKNFKLSTTDLWQMHATEDGKLLVAATTGLVVVDMESLKYDKLTPANTPGMSGQRVNAIKADAGDKNTIWLGTDTGLEKLDWPNKEFELFTPYASEPKSVAANHVRDIVIDNNGRFWLGTANGLIDYDTKTRDSKRYIHEPSDKFSLSGNDIWKLALDNKGALWIASDGGGVSIYDRQSKRFYNQMFEAGRPGSLNSNQVRTVYQDRAGDMWVGNYPTGINFFDRSSSAITSYAQVPSDPESMSHSSVLSIQEDANANLWLGTDGGGLNYYDREQDRFTHFTADRSQANALASNAILSVFIDSEGLIWTGSWGGGAAFYDPDSKRFTRLPYDEQRAIKSATSKSDRLNSAHVWSIREDPQDANLIWMTTHTGGLSSYHKKTGEFSHFTHTPGNELSLASNQTWTSFEDSRGRFWVGTNLGLSQFVKDTLSFKTFTTDPQDPSSLSNPSVLSIFEDSKGNLWFGTDGGLNLLNTDGETFTRFTKADGLLDDVVRHILEDDNGTLWLSTNNGFSSFDPQSKTFKNYNRESGRLVGSFHTESGVKSRQGEIIFGGVNGMRIIQPKALVTNTVKPPVVFTDFKIFADSVKVGGDDHLLTQSLNSTESITLDYTKSMFTLEFSALNFRNSSKNQYAYRLEGFDDNWLDVGNQRQAKYTNLNAGTYTFRVRASNNDGVWNETGASINIVQLPPPWKTWWAYTLYAFFVLAAIGWFIHHQKSKRRLVEEQNRILESKVSERTAELATKNNDIQAMLSNMPQGLFTILPDGKVHSEYSAYLEEIFATSTIAGCQAQDLLFKTARIGSDELDSVRAAIFAILGEDLMNFDFNGPLLIKEYEVRIAGQNKILALDWSPITEDNVIVKLMVSVRDVTKLRQMEMEAKDQKRQMEIIHQLLNVSAKKFLTFEESALNYIEANRQAIELHDECDQELISLMFRNMHTVKGNCRTYGFSHLSNIVHEVESAYTALKNNFSAQWDRDKLLDDLDLVSRGIHEYGEVYRHVLGREEDSQVARHDGFWMSNAVMEKIQTLAESRNLDKLIPYVNQINSYTLEEAIADVTASLPSIANQLGKKTPVVKFDTKGILIKSSILELTNDVFAHILRNSIDHGIEPEEERIDADKNERGTIWIASTIKGRQLHITVEDDGRGINVDRLFEKGIEKNLWPLDAKLNNLEIAQTIFKAGMSTKDRVTEISGRGVGMDAVKQFLKNNGGNVFIQLDEGKPCSKGYVPFKLIITLPEGSYTVDNPSPGSEEGLANPKIV